MCNAHAGSSVINPILYSSLSIYLVNAFWCCCPHLCSLFIVCTGRWMIVPMVVTNLERMSGLILQTHIAFVTSSVQVPTGNLLSPNQAFCCVCSKSGDWPFCTEKGIPTNRDKSVMCCQGRCPMKAPRGGMILTSQYWYYFHVSHNAP